MCGGYNRETELAIENKFESATNLGMKIASPNLRPPSMFLPTLISLSRKQCCFELPHEAFWFGG